MNIVVLLRHIKKSYAQIKTVINSTGRLQFVKTEVINERFVSIWIPFPFQFAGVKYIALPPRMKDRGGILFRKKDMI